MPKPSHPDVPIGHVHLKVIDLFELTQRFGRSAAFSPPTVTITISGSTPGRASEARPRRLDSTGLYHLAIVYPTRAELADALERLLRAGITLEGASDHGVSQALYLRDPDGNGVELYWNRPREEWPHMSSGELGMVTEPVNLESLLAAAK